MGLGENIRKAREKATISQKALADVLDVQQSTLSGYETQNHMPSENTIIKICDTLNVSADFLFGLIKTPMSTVRFDDEYSCGISVGELIERLVGIEDKGIRDFITQYILYISQNQKSFAEMNKKLKNAKNKKKQK